MQRDTERNIVRAEVKERPKRKVVNIPARLTTGSTRLNGFVVNFSARGVGMYVKTESPKVSGDYDSGVHANLEFSSPVGARLRLQCKVKWVRIHNIPAYGMINSIGMEIIDPPLVLPYQHNRRPDGMHKHQNDGNKSSKAMHVESQSTGEI